MAQINSCQYWSITEPPQCKYWDNDNTKCTLETAEQYPACNLIGTSITCNQYEKTDDSTTYFPRCILPDPRRHVCNRLTGLKWVTAVSGTYNFEVINEYNDGKCDGYGTATTCSGYSPFHLGFGILKPSPNDKYDTFEDGRFSTEAEFGYRLPINLTIYNVRAYLSKCYWWKNSPAQFMVTSSGIIQLAGTWNCINTNDTSKYSEFSVESGPPCNGCKPECPYYTGVCWQYCVDEKMETGDPILSEQIHELRYYHKENQWSVDKLDTYFMDQGHIFAWDGKRTQPENSGLRLKGELSLVIGKDNLVEEYEIPVQNTYMDNFDKFQVNHEHLILTKSTSVDGSLPNYPSLVREIELLQLCPIIKNRFTEDVESGLKYLETSLLDNTEFLIYGKSFFNEPVYVVNLNDPDIISFIPEQLLYYDSLLDAKLALGDKAYDYFTSQLNTFYDSLVNYFPDKVASNLVSDELANTFICKTKSFPNNFADTLNLNRCVAFQLVESEGLLFSKVEFVHSYVGALIVQSEFKLEGDGLPLRQPVDYRKAFNADVNKNGVISFEVVRLENGFYDVLVDNFYNDLYIPKLYSATQVVPDKPKLYLGYKLYKISLDFYILTNDSSKTEYVAIGEDGYILIDLNLNRLHNVYKPWEFESINIKYSETGLECELEVVYHGSSKLLNPQQLIVKPKNRQDYAGVCSNSTIIITGLTYYEKCSFDKEPVIIEPFTEFELVEETNYEYDYSKDNGDLSFDQNDNTISIKNFGFSMVPSLVVSNYSGRPFAQFKTKPIGWYKQPMCPDVEIQYSWTANYVAYDNYPVCFCCGPWSERNPKPTTFSYQPPCGDHDVSNITKVGPIWWPYTGCEAFATYDIVSNLDNYSFDVIGLFKETNEDDDKIHGDHDIRMLGPANNIAWHGRGCNFLIRCTCDWRTYNSSKVGDNRFMGWARVRGLVPDYKLSQWQEDGEILPKFGNVNRPQLESCRTIDSWQYEYSSDGVEWATAWMLMPAPMTFTQVDFTSDAVSSMWDYGDSGDGSSVFNPFGFFKADQLEKSHNVNETVDYNVRYKFNDIFVCRYSVDNTRYPSTKGSFVRSRKAGRIYPWYEFKPTGGFIGKTIQWAWQEPWQNLKRSKSFSLGDLLTKTDADNTNGPFINQKSNNGQNLVKGSLLFIDIKYPSYEYDFKNQEFELTIGEGEHSIFIRVPEKDTNTGEYNGNFFLRIDDYGPERELTWEGEWSTGTEDIYSECIGDGIIPEYATTEVELWSDKVTLFAPGYDDSDKASAEDDGRMIETYQTDMEGNELKIKTFFQKGLNVEILSNRFLGANLPTKTVFVDNDDLEGNFKTEISNVEYVCGAIGSGVTENFSLTSEFYSRTFNKIELSFKFGSELITPSDDSNKRMFKYFHVPEIEVVAVKDNTTLYRSDGMELYAANSVGYEVKKVVCVWVNTLDHIKDGHPELLIKLRTAPTDSDLTKLTPEQLTLFNKSINIIASTATPFLYEAILVDAAETIETYERRYYVSYGDSADAPPQGNNPEELHTLFYKTNHKSTVFNIDSNEGIQNMDGSENEFTICSKTRSRLLYEIIEDETILTGGVHTLEKKQKEFYDKAVSQDVDSLIMTFVVPPGLSELLSNNNISMAVAPNLVLTNTVVSDLAEINSFEPMSGEGHKYLPGKPSKTRCDVASPCGGLPDDFFDYLFVNQDANADKAATGIGYSDAFTSYYGGTLSMLERTDLAKYTIAGKFAKLYGASSENKIWVNPEQTKLIFEFLAAMFTDNAGVSSSKNSYNYDLFLRGSGHWHDVYFNPRGE